MEKYIALTKGIATYIPGLYTIMSKILGGISARTARYCYFIWLSHLIMAYKNGLSTEPKVVAELGPGDSLGVGLAALLSGANKYYALDVVKYIDTKRNLEIFNELVNLFKNREELPNDFRFPEVEPYLKSIKFPSYILTEDRLNDALKPDRIESIRKNIINLNGTKGDMQIFYFAPWYGSAIIKEQSVDMICSQAVLEHANNLEYIYESMYLWLKYGGFMSHSIDFECHGTANEWNGHWTYSDLMWKLISGKRPYLLNRRPHSAHITIMKKIGFAIICDIKIKHSFRKGVSRIQRKHLAPRFKNLSDDDLTTSRAFIQAIKTHKLD